MGLSRHTNFTVPAAGGHPAARTGCFNPFHPLAYAKNELELKYLDNLNVCMSCDEPYDRFSLVTGCHTLLIPCQSLMCDTNLWMAAKKHPTSDTRSITGKDKEEQKSYRRRRRHKCRRISVNRTYYAYSPNYPNNYTGGIACRWIATCSAGYNCKAECKEIFLPQTPQCAMDVLLISKSGDPQLAAADRYCGAGRVTAVSKDQQLSIGRVWRSQDSNPVHKKLFIFRTVDIPIKPRRQIQMRSDSSAGRQRPFELSLWV
ncbi:hypothetical protein EVAR_80654_1 [Eumeta japonica]|uniref:CUB domain-containing protein n=1 Tax=Eumeta variegata TaxID=151549 RepID=A0A4C1U3Z8_EUMVA|nr:hypothetical protein EVAR_80654_1 [Eumeta japonica]